MASALPSITEAVTIDGTSQPGYAGTPLIVVDGSGAGATTFGLVLGFAPAANGSTIQGLAVVNFGGYGILIQGDDDVILDSYLGTANGTTAAAERRRVCAWTRAAERAEIRGNLISGNVAAGIESNGTGLLIAGNRIGTNFSADGELRNGDRRDLHRPPRRATRSSAATRTSTPASGTSSRGNVEDRDPDRRVERQHRPGQPHRYQLRGDRPRQRRTPGVSIVSGGAGQPGRRGSQPARRSAGRATSSRSTAATASSSSVGASPDADFNAIHSNAIFENGGLGIDLEADGVTPNDPGDGDDGANDLTNFPDLIEAESDGEEPRSARSRARPPKTR